MSLFRKFSVFKIKFLKQFKMLIGFNLLIKNAHRDTCYFALSPIVNDINSSRFNDGTQVKTKYMASFWPYEFIIQPYLLYGFISFKGVIVFTSQGNSILKVRGRLSSLSHLILTITSGFPVYLKPVVKFLSKTSLLGLCFMLIVPIIMYCVASFFIKKAFLNFIKDIKPLLFDINN